MAEKNKNVKKSLVPDMEEEILNFWDKNKIFEKSVERKAPKGDYVFYDGPPFATGAPHYGHIVASLMKDIVPRYWTMNGYRVERKWGWDCHGLPIENIVEKEMGTKSKKDIGKIGIDKFNELCRSKVLGYVDDWKKAVRRMGRWVDMDNAYKTMDLDYMESVWWVFKQLWDKGLIYEGYRSMHICPRCETTLSQSEVAEGYKMVKDLSVTVKFELEDEPGTYLLAWTTTPWTLIGNVALAVGKDIEYVKIKYDGQQIIPSRIKDKELIKYSNIVAGVYILAKDIVWNNLNANGLIKDFINVVTYKRDLKEDIVNSFREVRKKYGDIDGVQRDNKAKDYFFKEYGKQYGFETIKGKDLVGKKYKSLFPYYVKNDPAVQENAQPVKNGWKVYSAKFVNTEEGTGIVHIAPAFGEDDMNLGKEENLPFIQHIGMDGVIKEEAKDFAGKNVSLKAKNNPEEIREIDLEILRFLGDKIFDSKKYEHSYPHCWRCDTPLLNYATSSWFVDITKIKDKMLKTAKKINWTPKHIKEGRFGNWLEGARDWSISRQRFWASVIPIWRCDKCGATKVYGSIKDLEKDSGTKIKDLHKHVVDKITFPCEKRDGTMKRVPDVLDCWFESGSMPYAQMHYHFENKEKFEKNFPAEFIGEGIDQTRAWFYYMHAIATGIKDSHAFKNVIVNGIVLAEDGKKMAKKLQNYPDPMEIMKKYGADSLRYYLCASPVMKADNISFSEKDLGEQTRFFNILLNVLSFYKMFSEGTEVSDLEPKDLVNVLDKWITARLEQTKQVITEKMDNYDLQAIREIPAFIDDLSTWYVRRSRDRFKGDTSAGSAQAIDKMRALKTLRRTLRELALVMAPFMPFMAEHIYQELGADVESVHLKEWAPVKKEWIEEEVLQEMGQIRKIVEMGLAKRDEASIKVRQPLAKLKVESPKSKVGDEYIELIKDEVNVKEVKFTKSDELSVKLDTELTPELKQEGIKRELVRAINNLRKEAGMTIGDRAIVKYETKSQEIKDAITKYGEDIKKDVLADEIAPGAGDGKVIKINEDEIVLEVKSI